VKIPFGLPALLPAVAAALAPPSAPTAQGAPPGGAAAPAVSATIAVPAAPDRTMEEPAGFDAFWADVRADAAAADLSSARRTPPEAVSRGGGAAAAGPGSFAFELPVGPGESASGFVVLPKRSPAAKLPLVVVFSGYSETDPTPTARHPLWGLPGAIVAHLSTHGFPPGRAKAFYAAAFEEISAGGTGGAFGFLDEENADARTSYFRRIAVRDLAAMRLLESLPEWDGRGVTLVGAHLGAWRAVAVAANDPAASGLALWSPWLCDLGGAETFGRPAGWLPTWQPALGFFDGVFLARRVKAPCAVVDAPLSAPDLPVAGVRLFVDALGGPKRAVWTPGGRPATKRLPGPEAVAGALEELRGLGAGNSGP